MAHEDAQNHPEFCEKYHFGIRRLHSLTGVIPLGVFLIIHLMTNASVLGGEQMFDQNVARIHSLGPLLIPVEIVGILVPLAFHVLLGIKIVTTAKTNQRVYTYGANIRYTLQRTTGVMAALFILYHLYHMHWIGKPLSFMGGAQFDPDFPTETAAAAMRASIVIPMVYAVGVICTVYHFANGLWTFLITWGITVGRRSQRVAGGICTAFGVALGAVGLAAVLGFQTFESEVTPIAPDTQAMSMEQGLSNGAELDLTEE